jgi:hypothetical protein
MQHDHRRLRSETEINQASRPVLSVQSLDQRRSENHHGSRRYSGAFFDVDTKRLPHV